LQLPRSNQFQLTATSVVRSSAALASRRGMPNAESLHERAGERTDEPVEQDVERDSDPTRT